MKTYILGLIVILSLSEQFAFSGNVEQDPLTAKLRSEFKNAKPIILTLLMNTHWTCTINFAGSDYNETQMNIDDEFIFSVMRVEGVMSVFNRGKARIRSFNFSEKSLIGFYNSGIWKYLLSIRADSHNNIIFEYSTEDFKENGSPLEVSPIEKSAREKGYHVFSYGKCYLKKSDIVYDH